MPEIFLVLYWKDLAFVGDGLYPFLFQILIRMLDHMSVAHIDHKNAHIFPAILLYYINSGAKLEQQHLSCKHFIIFASFLLFISVKTQNKWLCVL